MAQRIIDLDLVAPETLGVRIDEVVYDLPSDIPIPDYVEIERLTSQLEDAGDTKAIERLYEKVLDLFEELNDLGHLPSDDDGRPKLPLGPRRLGALVVQLYAGEVEEKARPTKPRGGTTSTSRKKPTRSRSSK